MVIQAAAPTRPVLTLAQAVDASDVSRSTLRRWLQTGKVPGAIRTDDGGWAIPVEGLLAAGAHLHAPGGPDPGVTTSVSRDHEPGPAGTLDALRAEVDELRMEVTLARLRREKAEAIAEERGRALDDARRMLRMLEAGPAPAHEPVATPVHDTPPVPAVDPSPEPARRRRRWRRH